MTAGEVVQAVCVGVLFVLASVSIATLHDDSDGEKEGGEE